MKYWPDQISLAVPGCHFFMSIGLELTLFGCVADIKSDDVGWRRLGDYSGKMLSRLGPARKSAPFHGMNAGQAGQRYDFYYHRGGLEFELDNGNRLRTAAAQIVVINDQIAKIAPDPNAVAPTADQSGRTLLSLPVNAVAVGRLSAADIRDWR